MTLPSRPGASSGPSYTPAAMLAELRRLDCEDSLLEFVRYLWHVLEPATTLVLGDVLEAVCAHLEAVTRGEENRLLVNVPPGSMKSLLTDVFWPAWEWTTRPHLRYVAFAYAAELTERDNRKFLALVSSPEYQRFWGEGARGTAKFSLVKQGEVLVSNSRGGFKRATSVNGLGTGERGDRVICFPYREIVQTEHGPQPIGRVVEGRYGGRVWAWDRARGSFDLKPIERWIRNPGRQLVRLRFVGGGTLTCTLDHKVMATSGAWRSAGSLRAGDRLLAAPRGMFGTAAPVAVAKRQIEVSPYSAHSDTLDRPAADTELFRENASGVVVTGGDLSDYVFGEVGCSVAEVAVPLAVGDVLCPCTVFEVGQDRVSLVIVSVTDLLPYRARPEERCGDYLVHEAVERLSADAQGHARVTLVQDRRHGLPAVDASAVVASRKAAHFSQSRNGVETFGADDIAPVIAHIECVELVHDLPETTYCLTVEDHHTLLCGTDQNIICSNCDDPHNVKQGESQAVRQSTAKWFTNALSNRLNDIRRSAIVVIMQRVHEEDVSGIILSKRLPYTHLMIPAEYEVGRDVSNALGWQDWRTEEGESFWPDRYPVEVLADMRKVMDPFAYAGQYQQRPDPKGGGILQRDWWRSFPGKVGGKRRPYPAFDYVVAALDTAFGEKQTNDFSAMTIWGVYTDDRGIPRALMMHAWAKRLPIHDLVEETVKTCRTVKPDRLLIEAKASGISLRQELRRLYAGEDWGVTMVDPGRQDKVARVHAIAHIFHEGIVQVPVVVDADGTETPFGWAQTVIDQAALFPKASHDDLVDTCSMALRHLRDLGLLRKAVEIQREDLELAEQPASLPKLYPA